MEKKTIYILIFCVVLAGALAFVYFKYKPLKNDYFDLSISAEYKGEKVETGFLITTLGISSNTTSSYETLSIETGEIIIKNINNKNQNFYEEEQPINLTKNTRVDLLLTKPEDVMADIKRDRKNDRINVTLYSENFREVDFCLRGSFSYFFIEAEPRTMKFFNMTDEKGKDFVQVRSDKYDFQKYPGYTIKNTYDLQVPYSEIVVPGFEDADVCYDGEFSLIGDVQNIIVRYLEYVKPNGNDFIEIIVVDKAGNNQTIQLI